MSRSYRKPIVTDGQNSKRGARKQRRTNANRRVRKAKDVKDGNAYRRVSNPWDICDYKFDLDMPKGKGIQARRARAKAVRK